MNIPNIVSYVNESGATDIEIVRTQEIISTTDFNERVKQYFISPRGWQEDNGILSNENHIRIRLLGQR